VNVRLLTLLFCVAFTFGCGQSDLNKDLKPVDPDAPRPKQATDKFEGGKKAPGEKSSPVAK